MIMTSPPLLVVMKVTFMQTLETINRFRAVNFNAKYKWSKCHQILIIVEYIKHSPSSLSQLFLKMIAMMMIMIADMEDAENYFCADPS